MTLESQIQADIDALKERFPETKSLYREVCALLFFRHGITPTASKLYQLVRKGSMSAPADALAKFWEELRAKARIEIDHPDLPVELRDTAAAAIAGIWQQATATARQELASLRLEAQEQVTVASSSLAGARAQIEELDSRLKAAGRETAAAETRGGQLRDELELERRDHAGARARIEELQRQLAQEHAAQEAAHAAFSADLTKARDAVNVANERADSSDRRALLEIDQERQARARAEKQSESLRNRLADSETQARDQAQSATESYARMEARLNALEVANRELTTQNAQARAELDATGTQLDAAHTDATRFKAEADILRDVLKQIKPAEPSPARATRTRR